MDANLSLVVQAPELTAPVLAELRTLSSSSGREATATDHGRVHVFANARPIQADAIAALARSERFDFGWVPANRRLADFALAAFDMDSTLITIECVDEIADFAGVKAEVAAITEAAMRGEIADYQESLRRRVALLAGLPESVLEAVYQERLRLTPGAERLIASLHAAGLKVLLVSGGFTYFTSRLQQRLGLDETLSNTLEVQDGKLTGRLVGTIVDASAKAARLESYAATLGIDPSCRAIAVGDGANDLAMMAKAAIAVAHRAKPAVQARATYAINHVGLDGLVPFLEAPDVS